MRYGCWHTGVRIISFQCHREKGSDLLWLLSLRNLALPVEVPDRLGQELGDIRALLLEDIPNVVDGADITLPAELSLGEAEQSDEVRVIGMEELAGVLHAVRFR